MNISLLWIMVPLAPLTALGFSALTRQQPRWLIWWSWLGCLPAMALSIQPLPAFEPGILWDGARWGAEQVLPSAWLAFTAALWAAAGLYAAFSQRHDTHRLRFWLYWQLALSGNLLLIISQDALSFYVGFSMMSLSAYGLVVHHGTPDARRAGRLYLQLAVLGEVLLFAGILMRAHAADGSVLFADWVAAPLDPWAAVLLIVGLGLKAGFWPLHVWLPVAHPAAPAPASAVLSGAMIKAGIVGIWLFLPAGGSVVGSGDISWTLQQWAEPLMIVGIVSAFFGVAAGLTRKDAKQVLAYSSVSQMGYLLFIVALGWLLPEQGDALAIVLVVYVIHHGFAKGALFLSADLLKHSHTRSVHHIWMLLILLAVPALALSGLILTSGVVAKSGLKSILDGTALAAYKPVLQLGALASTLLLARAWWLLAKLRGAAQHEPARAQLLVWAALCLTPVLLPWFWPQMRAVLWQTLSLNYLVDASWPIILALLLACAAHWQRWQAPTLPAILRHPFMIVSLWLSRRLNRALLPSFDLPGSTKSMRAVERRWNRYWQGGTVNRSAALLLVFMVVAGFVILLGTG